MSINWVMLPPKPSPAQPFTPLPSESTLYTSPARTSISIASIGKFPAHQPLSLNSSSGTIYLTTKRLIYLPSPPTAALQSFSTPLLNLQDSHVTAPWIGPNVWTALLRPVAGGNLDTHPALDLRLTFRDGGAYDFQTAFERLRERIAQALETARASGQDVDSRQGGRHGRGPGPVAGVEVVMEDLPRYEEGESRTTTGQDTAGTATPEASVFTPPVEPPPGYDQVQREVIEDEFSQRLTNARLRDEGNEANES